MTREETHYEAYLLARAQRAEAAIQRVRDECQRTDVPAVMGDWQSGYVAARQTVLRLLDGDQ